jgi:hypothetical protein
VRIPIEGVQGALFVDAEDKTDYLRFGNVKFDDQVLRLPYQEKPKHDPTFHAVEIARANL